MAQSRTSAVDPLLRVWRIGSTHDIGLLAHGVRCDSAVLDGEIVCLQPDGRSHFYNLMFRREWPDFMAFDLLWVNGYSSAWLTSSARWLRGTTLIIGSIWKIVTAGFTSRIASIAWIAARTSCRFSSSPRCCANGLKIPASPAAHEKNEISLTGDRYGVGSYSLMYFVASRANATNRSTNWDEKMSMSSGHP